MGQKIRSKDEEIAIKGLVIRFEEEEDESDTDSFGDIEKEDTDPFEDIEIGLEPSLHSKPPKQTSCAFTDKVSIPVGMSAQATVLASVLHAAQEEIQPTAFTEKRLYEPLYTEFLSGSTETVTNIQNHLFYITNWYPVFESEA